MALATPNGSYMDGTIAIHTYDVGAKAIPNVPTQEISRTCRLRHLSIRNPSGGSAISFTVQDGSGNLLYSSTLNSGGLFEVDKARPGQILLNGIQWQATGAGLIGDILAEALTTTP